MLRCPACEQEFTWKGKRVTVCARCKRKILIPCSLEFQNPVYQQAAFRDSKIFKIQISEENGQEEIAKIRGNAGEPGKWEIENLGQAEWDIITPNGEKQTIPYGGILPVLPGTVIQIGQQQIKIRENDKPEEREDNDTVEHCV